MKSLTRRLVLVVLTLTLSVIKGWAAEREGGSRTAPTLARLSFWVSPQRTTEFGTVYEAKVAPILKTHGLVASSERGRATPDSIFSRLFELKTPAEVADKQKALQGDSTWAAVLRSMGTAFGTPRPDSLIRNDFLLYTAPAGPGKVVPAGPGKKVPAGRGTGHWRTYDIADGLAGEIVNSIIQDREGYLWFGTIRGLSRYDGQTFITFTIQDGLADNQVRSIFQDREGYLWFGTLNGVSRYDGQTFTTFTTQDGLAHNSVRSILQDRDRNFWFGAWGGGVSRYDGQNFTTFTTQDGLADNNVPSIFQDREGYLWVGPWGSGVSRYDGKTFTTFTTKDGLADNNVPSILQDREGVLWFGTFGGGVSRYDGKAFTTFTTQDGLAYNGVLSIFQDQEGVLWFGTSGGVSRYDGKTFQTMLQQDGLAGNVVRKIFQDKEGNLWFVTHKGVTRYRPPGPSSPPVFVDAVVADRRYERVSELATPSSMKLTTFEFHGVSFKTRPEGMVYRYRLKGYDRDWKTTHARRVEYQDLPIGTYTFEVQAVDRDLVYSEKPATVRLTIHPPYGIIALASGLGLALAVAAVASGYAIKRRRDLRRTEQALMRELEKELQTAHEMQMSLMPREHPQIEGLDIAGRCVPANHVGGDYFQYFHIPENRLVLVLADVTGHAMEAAIPVVMFSGILKSHMELGGALQERFQRLNRSIYGTIRGRTLGLSGYGRTGSVHPYACPVRQRMSVSVSLSRCGG